jgi:hypothetical protein
MLTQQLIEGQITIEKAQEIFCRFYGRRDKTLRRDPLPGLQQAEKDEIDRMLRLGGTIEETAKLLGCSVRGLRYKMHRYGLATKRPRGRRRQSLLRYYMEGAVR